ncbi:MAG: serine hydrolase [Candidatus Hodarchaeales archaeon]|jgi:CubicO group peptidase (beta-lactamase class C family)
MKITQQIEEFERKIPKLMQTYQIPGMAYAIIKDQRVIYSNAFGARDFKKKLEVNSDTLFGIGSVTKSFTCIAVMQLVEAGQLDLEDPISKYLPFNLGNTDNPITIRHLMSHTSGIPNLGLAEAVIAREGLSIETFIPLSTTEDVLRYINEASEEIRFAPGKEYFYFNGGYALLCLIIEKIAGMQLEDYIDLNILKPLEMTRSTLKEKEFKEDPNKATAYLIKPHGRVEPTSHMFDKNAKAAGGLFSSVIELGNYLILAMHGGVYKGKQILNENSLHDMYVIQKGSKKDHGMYGDFGYGYGWGITDDFFGHKLYGHGGSTLVSSAYVGFLSEEKLGIAIAANNGNAPLGIFGQAIIASLLGRDIDAEIPFFKVQKKFEKLIGQYTSYSDFYNPKIVLKEGMLFFEMKVADLIDQNVPLIPKNRTIDNFEFYIFNMGIIQPIKFIIHETGDVDLQIERNLFHKVRG